jgi:hypothetical protein
MNEEVQYQMLLLEHDLISKPCLSEAANEVKVSNSEKRETSKYFITMFKDQSISPIIFRYQHFLLKLLKKVCTIISCFVLKDY